MCYERKKTTGIFMPSCFIWKASFFLLVTRSGFTFFLWNNIIFFEKKHGEFNGTFNLYFAPGWVGMFCYVLCFNPGNFQQFFQQEF